MRDDERGNTAIEFALIAPLLFLLFFGIIELGLIQFCRTTIESASNTSTRLATTGNFNAGKELAKRTYGLIDSGLIRIDRQVVVEGNGNGSRPDSGAIIRYRITYPWRLFTPLLSSFIGEDGVYTITSYSFVKNEPYE